MEFTAKQIAEVLNGKVEGDENIKVSNLSKIEEGNPGTLSFLANPAYEKYIYETNASIVIVNEDFTPEKPVKSTLIRVKDAYAAFAGLLEFYNSQKKQKTGISEKAHIEESANIGNDVYVGEFTVIGENSNVGDGAKIYPNVTIGDNVSVGKGTVIYPGVKIYDDCVVGDNCTIHAGVVIGSDGFGFAPQDDGYKKVPQIGNVIIEDNVEIGSNTVIDRATLGSTIIKKGVKLDNLIQVAHNVVIGENTVVAAQTGISGSTKLGKNMMVGGQVGFVGHLNIGDGVMVQAQSGVTKNFKSGEAIEGSPAIKIADFRRSYVHFKNLDSIVKRLNELEKTVNKK